MRPYIPYIPRYIWPRLSLLHTVYFQPLKMELTHGSETSAYYTSTPGKYTKEHIQYSNHSESLKSTSFNELTNAKNLVLHSSHFALN